MRGGSNQASTTDDRQHVGIKEATTLGSFAASAATSTTGSRLAVSFRLPSEATATSACGVKAMTDNRRADRVCRGISDTRGTCVARRDALLVTSKEVSSQPGHAGSCQVRPSNLGRGDRAPLSLAIIPGLHWGTTTPAAMGLAGEICAKTVLKLESRHSMKVFWSPRVTFPFVGVSASSIRAPTNPDRAREAKKPVHHRKILLGPAWTNRSGSMTLCTAFQCHHLLMIVVQCEPNNGTRRR